MRGDAVDKTCLSWWFPRIEAAGLRVPKTKVLLFEGDGSETRKDFFEAFDGKPLGPKAVEFVHMVRKVAERDFKVPLFLRTGQTSGKHEWKHTCKVEDLSKLDHHMMMIIQYSELVDFMGIPWNVWAVREFLKLKYEAVLPEYCDMPLSQEWRLFVEDGKVTHVQPYWTPMSLVQGGMTPERAEEYVRQQMLAGVPHELKEPSLKAAAACEGGGWSVDWCLTEDGEWFLTDMAEAAQSYRWKPGDPETAAEARKAPEGILEEVP